MHGKSMHIYEYGLIIIQATNSYLLPVVPLRLYVAKLVQHFEKLTQWILWEWVKKDAYSWQCSDFQPKLVILAQEPLQFCQIWENWP